LKLRPGQPGTKKLLSRYGDRLVCVRYRYDERRKRRYKTVELIVDEVGWEPKTRPLTASTIVGVKVELHEKELRERVKQAGGRWNPERKLWEIRYGRVLEMGLGGRIKKRTI
jgi:hypothetical protein